MRCLLTAAEIRDNPVRWARLRDELVGASEIGSIMGVEGAYRSAFETYQRKTRHEDSADTIELRIGRHYEPLVLELFAEQYPKLAVADGGLYVSTEPGREWQAATYDALAYGKTSQPIPVQAKTCYRFDPEHWGEPPYGQIPASYLAQCLQEIDIADASEAYLPVVPTGQRGPLRVYRIMRDAEAEADIVAMREAGDEFYQRLLSGDPPPIDGSEQTRRALIRLHRKAEHVKAVVPASLGRRARRARARLKAAEAAYRLCENELRDRMGPATLAVTRDGDVIATRSLYTQRRVRTPDLRVKHPRIAKRFGYDVPIDRLTIKQPLTAADREF